MKVFARFSKNESRGLRGTKAHSDRSGMFIALDATNLRRGSEERTIRYDFQTEIMSARPNRDDSVGAEGL